MKKEPSLGFILKKLLIVIILIISVLFYSFLTMFLPLLAIILLPLIFIILLLSSKGTSYHHKLNKNRNLSLALFFISLIIANLLLLGALLSRCDAWGPIIYASFSFPFIIVCLTSLLYVLSSSKKAQEKNEQNLVYYPLYIASLIAMIIGLLLLYFLLPIFAKEIKNFDSIKIFALDFQMIFISLVLIMSFIIISIKKLFIQILNRAIFYPTAVFVLISFLVTFLGILFMPDFIDQNKKEKSTENQKVIESLINQQLELYCENNNEEQLSNNLIRETLISNALVEFKDNKRVLYISYPLYQEWVEKYIVIEEYCNKY